MLLFYHRCVYTHRGFYTPTHSPETFHSFFFTISLRRAQQGPGLHMLSFQEPLQAPDAELSPSRGRGAAPHSSRLPLLDLPFLPTRPFHHSCPSCFPTKVTLPIALERDQLLTFLFLALRHALVMLIEVQICTAHLAQAKNQNSPGLVPACTKVLKWFGLVQHFITQL